MLARTNAVPGRHGRGRTAPRGGLAAGHRGRQAFRLDAGAPALLVRPPGGRGARHSRREWLGQNHAGQDPGGVHRPDAGRLDLGGRRATAPDPPRGARAGIVTVFQEVLAAAQLTVLDNVWLGPRDWSDTTHPRVKRGRAAAPWPACSARRAEPSPSPRSRSACGKPVHRPGAAPRPEDPGARRGDLGPGRRHPRQTVRASAARAAGARVVFISHRMDEIEQIGDRFTVLRSGVSVATLDRGPASATNSCELMTGGTTSPGAREAVRRGHAGRGAVVLLDARRCVSSRARRPSTSRSGRVSSSAWRASKGTVRTLPAGPRAVSPRPSRARSSCAPAADRRHRHATPGPRSYVPRDRRSESIFESRSVLDNFALPTQARDRQGRPDRPGPGRRRFRVR